MRNKDYKINDTDNVFSIIAYVTQAMRENGISPRERNEYTIDATSKDWEHLINVSQSVIDRLNQATRIG